MKKFLKWELAILLFCTVFIMSYGMNTRAADVIYSGTSGELNWSIDSTGHFILSGTGDYNYFDRNWEVYKEEIVTAEINVNGITDLDSLFEGCLNLESVDLENLDTSNVRSTSSMFQDCSSLTTLDISNFDTGKVVNMSNMFSGCSSLVDLNLNGLNTSNVMSISDMFRDCNSLVTLDISFFDTGQVVYMDNVFCDCKSLETLDVSKWDTSNVETMSFMFSGCDSISLIDVSDWNTSNVRDMSAMFQSCYNLQTLDVSGWNTSKVEDMGYMFSYCSSIRKLDVSGWNTSSLENMEMLFNYCTELTVLDVSGFNTSNVTNMCSVFSHCENVVELDVRDFNTSEATDMSSMFLCCENVEKLDVSGFNTNNVISMESMFRWCDKLNSIDVSNFDTRKVINVQGMFSCCGNLQQIDLHNFDLSCLSDEFSLDIFEDSKKVNTIYTPVNLKMECLLPQIVDSIWQDENENIYTILPMGETQSILLTLKTIPCEHVWGSNETTDKKATCTEDGLKLYTCGACGQTKTETIKKLGHNYSTKWIVDKKATTSANGSKSKHCTRCNAKTSVTTIYKASNVKLGTVTYVYNGTMRSPSVVIKDSKGNVIGSVNYTISKPAGRKNVGKYTYKITFKNQYSGTKSLTLTINPKGTSISSLTKAKKAFIVKWKKQETQTTGYQICYGTSTNKNNCKKVLVTSNKTLSKKITGLKSGKKYYVWVRTYKTVNGTKYYSAWSTSKSVTTK